jgi:uncharacterized protein (TIGR02231 family)
MTMTAEQPGTEVATTGQAGTGPGEQGVAAPITGVTVFRDGARIVRTGTLDVAAGLHRLAAGRLPATADSSSVRVAVRGAGVTLLEVEVTRQYRTAPLREDVRALKEQAERLRDGVKELEDEDAAESAGLGFLGHLSQAAATSLARAVSGGRADYAELTRMATHLADGTGQSLGRRRDIAARLRAARRELEAAEQRLAAAERRRGDVQEYNVVMVAVEAEAAGPATMELEYHVSGASWPLYDLALEGEQLTVSYLAEVTQRTDEDWPETRLVLSTARPGQHRGLPELSPWYIGRAQPAYPPSRQRARAAMPSMVAGAAMPPPSQPMAAPAGAAYGAAAPKREFTAEVSEGGEAGAGISYTVARPVGVPSDGAPHKTLVARFEADAVLDYLTVPVLAAEAYLRATVTNGSLLLLPGTARVFHGAAFVGETALETVAAGEEFEVQLGVDDQIRVERKLTRRATSKAVLGATRTVDIGYEITVENHRGGKARISVHDHVPVSNDGDIRVRAREQSPAPAGTDDLGEVTWELILGGGKSATIRHRFTVEHPASVTVSGL